MPINGENQIEFPVGWPKQHTNPRALLERSAKSPLCSLGDELARRDVRADSIGPLPNRLEGSTHSAWNHSDTKPANAKTHRNYFPEMSVFGRVAVFESKRSPIACSPT